MPQRYTATTRLFFGVSGGESVSDLAQGSNFAEKQMRSYARDHTSDTVPQAMIEVMKELPEHLRRS
jgi:succinoglycan biosynthesis transport protein ExoP